MTTPNAGDNVFHHRHPIIHQNNKNDAKTTPTPITATSRTTATNTNTSDVEEGRHHRRHSTEQSPLVGGDATLDSATTAAASPTTTSSGSPMGGGGTFQKWLKHAHLSMMEGDEPPYASPAAAQHHHHHGRTMYLQKLKQRTQWLAVLIVGTLVVTLFYVAVTSSLSSGTSVNGKIVPVEQAHEYWLELPPDPDTSTSSDSNVASLKIWFRTWGRMDGTGIPILFVHGGPGNAIADYYDNSNKRFFQDAQHSFFVVEVDQRGTGNSQPSVRDDWKNMKYYKNISIDKMCADFEVIRKHLGIDQWLVWGGSFGSTLAINYGERYPSSSLALVLRGLYLDTADEVYTIYSRKTYLDNRKRLHEFDIFFDYAAQYVEKHIDEEGDMDDSTLDPNDAERILRVYAEMITRGDKLATWHWFVFENNLMELDPQRLLDPNTIDDEYFHESLSVSFFETRLWLHGSFEEPTSNLLDTAKIDRLTMPMWICQGQRDEVCPPEYARRFVDTIVKRNKSPWIVSRFLNATHEDSDPLIEICLKQSLTEFVEYHKNHYDEEITT